MNGPPRSIYSTSDDDEYPSNYTTNSGRTLYRRRSRNQSSRNSLSSIGSQNRLSIEGTIVPYNNTAIPNMILNLPTPNTVIRRNSKHSKHSSHSTEKVQYRKRHVKKTRKRAATAKSSAKHAAAKPKHSRKQKRLQKRASRNSTK